MAVDTLYPIYDDDLNQKCQIQIHHSIRPVAESAFSPCFPSLAVPSSHPPFH